MSSLPATLDPKATSGGARGAEKVPHGLGYMRQLDGLRGVAVLLVLYTHFLPEPYWLLGKYWGGYGVRLFFVLSSFLITGILLRCRSAVAGGAASRPQALRVFYIRRFLRIFPVYYATLTILYLIGMPEIRESAGWHFSYLSNVFFAIRGDWHGSDAALWSLSVEEQFYLAWPWLVLFTPRKRLLWILVALCLFAPAFRFAGFLAGLNPIAIWVLTPSLLDMLGIGALLALLSEKPGYGTARVTRLVRWLAMAGILLVLVVEYLSSRVSKEAAQVLDYSASALIFAWVVYHAATGFRGLVGRLLNARGIVYIGTISYGIYLFHDFVRAGVGHASSALHIDLSAIPSALVNAALTISLAALSWRILERPVNALKRHFDYPYETAARSGRVPLVVPPRPPAVV